MATAQQLQKLAAKHLREELDAIAGEPFDRIRGAAMLMDLHRSAIARLAAERRMAAQELHAEGVGATEMAAKLEISRSAANKLLGYE